MVRDCGSGMGDHAFLTALVSGGTERFAAAATEVGAGAGTAATEAAVAHEDAAAESEAGVEASRAELTQAAARAAVSAADSHV